MSKTEAAMNVLIAVCVTIGWCVLVTQVKSCEVEQSRIKAEYLSKQVQE